MNNLYYQTKFVLNIVLLLLNIYAACNTNDKILEQLFMAMTAITALYSCKIMGETSRESSTVSRKSYKAGLVTEQ